MTEISASAPQPSTDLEAWLLEEFIKLGDRVEYLEAKLKRRGKDRAPRKWSPDAEGWKIVNFLSSMPAGVKMTRASIAASTQLDSNVVGGRIATLVKKGYMKAEKPDRSDWLYWVNEVESDGGASA